MKEMLEASVEGNNKFYVSEHLVVNAAAGQY